MHEWIVARGRAMLRQVAQGVWVHQSEFLESNAVLVRGADGMLLIDAGIHSDEMVRLAHDLSEMGQAVVAGFSTHPHWDHLLWHASLGGAPRYGTALCATTARDRLAGGFDSLPVGKPPGAALGLAGGH